MKKSTAKVLALALMAGAISESNGAFSIPEVKSNYVRIKTELTKKQRKARAKSKAGRKQRKYNSINKR